jgi:hypothetical protein
MVTPHPLAAAAAEVRADELRARAAQQRYIKLGHGDEGRPTSRRGLRRPALMSGRLHLRWISAARRISTGNGGERVR